MRTVKGSIVLALGLWVIVIVVSVTAAGVSTAAAEASAQGAEGDKININTATADELIQLEGIGSVKSGNIIEFREQQGPFRSIEDLKKVPGIGQKTFDKNKDRIIVE
jgi:competence protein ComEA